MRSKKLPLAVVLVIATLSLAAQPVLAGVVGMRLSVTQVDQGTGQVDFDATAFMPSSPPEIQIGDEIDRTIAFTYTTVLGNYYGLGSVNYLIQLGSRSDFNTNPHPAIVYGDGDTVPEATLAWIGGVEVDGTTYQGYRGSFSHTYMTEGTFDLRVFAGPDGETGNPGLGPATEAPVAGNPIVGNLTNVFSVSRFVAPTSDTGNPVANEQSSSVFNYPNTVRYITARTVLNLGDTTTMTTTTPPGGDNIIEVPTLTSYWMLALAAFLGLSGAFLIRRR